MEKSICRACNDHELKRFVSLGNIPPVNAFLNPEDITNEKAHPLNMAYCPSCLLAQLEQIVPPEELFSHYLHLSAGSPSNINHLQNVSKMLQKRFSINPDTKILEIGSNDSTLLAFLKEHTPHLLGVDPAKNLVQVSKDKGIDARPLFFNTDTAAEIIKEKGLYDLIVALNVIPHTPNVVDLLRGTHMTLNKNGTLMMEGAYALETMLQGQFDTLYHEHVYSFSLHSLISTFKQANLNVIDVEQIPTQGSSLRIFAQRNSESQRPKEAVYNLLDKEKSLGLTNPAIFDQVNPKVEKFKKDFRSLIESEKAKGRRLIGLGAPARGVVIMNYCDFRPDDMEFIIDDTPLKQGRVSPGSHIPVKSWSALTQDPNNTFVLLSWNYKDHLISKIKSLAPKSRIIVPFPNLEIIQHG